MRGAGRHAPLLLFVAALGLFCGNWGGRSVPFHPDTVRELLLAEDCALHDRCLTQGPQHSFAGLVAGATWIHVLAAVRALGGGLPAVVALATASEVLASLLLFAFVWRSGEPGRGRGAAAAAAGLALPAMLRVALAPDARIWQPTLLPLAATLTVLGLAALHRRPGVPAALLAGACFGWNVDVHPVAASLAAPAVVALASGRSSTDAQAALRAILWAGAGLLVPAVLSPGALARNASLLGLPAVLAGLCFAALAALGVVLVRGLRGPSRVPDVDGGVDEAGQLPLLGVALAAPLLAGVGVAALTGHPLEPRYLVPAAPAAALLVARVVRALPSALGGAFVAALAAPVALSLPRDADRSWTLDDARVFAQQTGLAWSDAMMALAGPGCWELASATALYDRALYDGERGGGALPDSSLVMVVPDRLTGDPASESAEAGWRSIVLPDRGPVRIARRRALVDRRRGRVCDGAQCRPFVWDPRARLRLPDRAYVSVRGLDGSDGFSPGRYELGLRVPAGSPDTDVFVSPDSAPCPWRVDSVVGVAHEPGRLQGVRLLGRPDEQSGTLTLVTSPCAPHPWTDRLPPCLMEARQDDEPVLEGLEP